MKQRILVLALPLIGASLCACGADQPSSAGETGGGGATSGGTSATGTPGTGGGGAAGTGSGGAAGTGGGGADGLSAGLEIMHADFQQRSPGKYTMAMVSGDFGGKPPWNNGLDAGRATIVDQAGNRFLRVTYAGGQYGAGPGGVQFKVPLGKTYSQLYLAYRVRFAVGFTWMKGGKLPGFAGGSAPTGCVNDTTGFSARMMWHSNGAPFQYMYFPEKVNLCGDVYDYMSGGKSVPFKPGTWHTVEHRLVMNTPGQHDGVLQAWLDGQPVLNKQGFLYRLSGKTYGIDALYFSTFFGGNDQTYAPPSNQIADFDDFIVSTGPITH